LSFSCSFFPVTSPVLLRSVGLRAPKELTENMDLLLIKSEGTWLDLYFGESLCSLLLLSFSLLLLLRSFYRLGFSYFGSASFSPDSLFFLKLKRIRELELLRLALLPERSSDFFTEIVVNFWFLYFS
jgi:hypothetical protein